MLTKLGVKVSRQQNKNGKQRGGQKGGNQQGGKAATRQPTLTEARGPSQPLQTEPSSSAAAHGTVPPVANGTAPPGGTPAGDAGVSVSAAHQASGTAAGSAGSTQRAVHAAANGLAGRKRGREQGESLQGEAAAKHAKPDASGGAKPIVAAPLQSNGLHPGSAAEPVKLYNVRK